MHLQIATVLFRVASSYQPYPLKYARLSRTALLLMASRKCAEVILDQDFAQPANRVEQHIEGSSIAIRSVNV